MKAKCSVAKYRKYVGFRNNLWQRIAISVWNNVKLFYFKATPNVGFNPTPAVSDWLQRDKKLWALPRQYCFARWRIGTIPIYRNRWYDYDEYPNDDYDQQRALLRHIRVVIQWMDDCDVPVNGDRDDVYHTSAACEINNDDVRNAQRLVTIPLIVHVNYYVV